MLNHLIEKGLAISHRVFTPLIVPLMTDWPRMLTPDGRVEPLTPMQNDSSQASFEDTGIAGIYRLTAAARRRRRAQRRGRTHRRRHEYAAGGIGMERISEADIGNLMPGFRVTTHGRRRRPGRHGTRSFAGTWSFPFAVVALCALLAAVILAWAPDRPKPASCAAAGKG